MSRKNKNPSTGVKVPKLKKVARKTKRGKLKTGKHRI